MMAVVISVGHM